MSNMKQRVVFPKPGKTIIDERVQPDVFVLKFHEGTHIRYQQGTFVFDSQILTPQERDLLTEAKLDADLVKSQLSMVHDLLDQLPGAQVERLLNRSDDALAKDKLAGEQASGEQLADLGLYFYIGVKSGDPGQIAQTIDQLNMLDIIERVEPQYITRPARVDIAPATPDFTARQGYLDAAPGGINARFAWTIPGGQGAGVRLVDVETAWHRDHEDFPPLFWDGAGINVGDLEHGTAVVSILAAPHNGYGVSGIAPDAQIGVSTVVRLALMPVPAAIDDAATHLSRGDIILIEQHAHGPSSGRPCDDGNCDQWEFVCQEYWQQDFDVIRTATARGIIVVEAAGNGGMDLDSPIYEGRFNRNIRDSGAILVGAGMSGSRAPQGWSNFGSRVDVQGWGDSVMSAGYGRDGFRLNGDDGRQWYTPGFSGTSSASPIVAGAAACVQGARRQHGLPLLDSFALRTLLHDTGTSQPIPISRQIGPLPDLQRAINSFVPLPRPTSGWVSLGGVITSAPVVGQRADGRMAIFARGTDNRLWHLPQTARNNGWGSWTRLGDAPLAGRPTVIRNTDGRMEVFARGIDSAIWHIWETAVNGPWSGWESLGGAWMNDPAVGINHDGRLEVFALGVDNRLHHRQQMGWAGGAWNPVWSFLGERLIGTPTVVRWPDGRLEVFSRLTDGTVWHRWQVMAGGDWATGGVFGGVGSGDPIAVINPSNTVELFMRGLDGALWHRWWSGGWSGWDSLGGLVPADNNTPAYILNPLGGGEVFMRGMDNAVWHQWTTSTPPYWSGWASLDGAVDGAVAVGANADRRLEVFVRGIDGVLWHRWQVDTLGNWNS